MNRTAAALFLAIALTACATDQTQYSLEGSSRRMAKANAERAFADTPSPTALAGDVDTPAKKLRVVLPSYPQELVEANEGGSVSVQFYIEPDGTVSDAALVGSPHSELGAITLKAIMQWRFSPAIKDGKPIRTKVVQKFRFEVE
jgi:TonB family protein